MTPQQENEAISIWAGLECRCVEVAEPVLGNFPEYEPSVYWGSCPRHSNGGLPPDYDRDEVAINLLPLIMEKGLLKRVLLDCYRILPDTSLVWRIEGYKGPYPSQHFMGDSKHTIAAAIKAAVLALISKA